MRSWPGLSPQGLRWLDSLSGCFLLLFGSLTALELSSGEPGASTWPWAMGLSLPWGLLAGTSLANGAQNGSVVHRLLPGLLGLGNVLCTALLVSCLPDLDRLLPPWALLPRGSGLLASLLLREAAAPAAVEHSIWDILVLSTMASAALLLARGPSLASATLLLLLAMASILQIWNSSVAIMTAAPSGG